MAVANINPAAAAGIYETAQKAPKLDINAPELKGLEATESFNKVMEAQQNAYSRLNSKQILAKINAHKAGTGANVRANNGLFNAVTNAIKDPISKAEDTTRKTMIGEASFLELTIASQNAKSTLQAMVTTREKLLEAFNKVLNMNL